MARTPKAIAHAVRTVVEGLEPRHLLSNTLISGPTSISSGSAYTLKLNTPQQGSGVSWNVAWGDGSNTNAVSGNTLTASHQYASGTASASISATLSSMPKPLDTSFGASGKVVTDMGSAADHAYDVAVVTDSDPVNGGKVVVAGGAGFSIARYNPDGSLDTTFGSGGKVAIGGTSASFGLAIQPDGKYLVGGGENFAMARFNADGSLDTSFGANGIASSGFGTTYQSYDLALLPNGKIVQAGKNGNDMVIARFNANGSVEGSFGSGGKRITDFAGSLDKGFGLAVDTSGRLVVVGQERNGATNFDWAIARYTVDGALDSTFGSGGKVTTNFGSDDELAWSVDIQSDGKIVVGGRTKNANDYDFALARYNTDGSLDSSFGTGGKQTTDFGSGGDQIYALKVLSDGRIAAVGWAQSSSNAMDFGVALYQSTGQLDTSFATGGKYRQDFAASTDNGEAIAVQSDGDLVIAGSASTVGSNGASDFAVTRLHMGNTGVFVAGDTGTPGGAFQTSFKFGVDNSAAVPGYITEIGNEYEDNLWSSGYDYGWVDQATGASTKNSTGEIGDVHASPALKNSAVRSFKDGTPLAWQIKVPNGSYYVKLVAGDPTASSGTYKYGVEGNVNFLSGTGQFVTATGIVTVTDGKLTVFNGSGATTGNALSYIEITDAAARNRSTVTAPTGVAATATGVVNTTNNTTGVDVRWEDKSDNETGFKIERATNANGTWTPLGTANANAGVFTDLTASFNTTYYYRVSAVKGSAASATTTPVFVTTPASGAQTVYGNGGIAWNTDTSIQAEDFDAGGAGVADSDIYDGNAGGYYRASNTDIGYNRTDGRYFIGWTRVGEWIEYTMNVQTPGTYRLDLSAASQGQGGTFSITTGSSSTELGRVAIPDTTSFRTYTTISSGTFTLPQGVTVLRLTAIDDGISPYWLGDMDSLKLVSAPGPPPVTGSINGKVFNDANNNGMFDAGEGGLVNWQVFADLNGNSTFDAGEPSATSAADGTYTIGNLAAGSYTIVETPQPGYTETEPAGASYGVTLAAGQAATGKDFGNYQVTGGNTPVITITANLPNASETGPTNGQYTVTRSVVTNQPLVVNYVLDTTNSTATSGSDFVALSGTVTIQSNMPSATIDLIPLDDAVAEGDEIVELTLALTPTYTISNGSAYVTIFDNDSSGVESIDLDVFEDVNGDGVHDNSPAAEAAEQADSIQFDAVGADENYTHLALVVSNAPSAESLTFDYPSDIKIFKDPYGRQPINSGDSVTLSDLGIQASGEADLFAAITATSNTEAVPAAVATIQIHQSSNTSNVVTFGPRGIIPTPPATPDPTTIFNNDALEGSQTFDNNGGLDDGDGNQALTDRDDFWTDPLRGGTRSGLTKNTLVIGFSGHTQSLGMHGTSGAIWDIDPNCGAYQIGEEIASSHTDYAVTMFPRRPRQCIGT